jgi:hypothetical protein
MQANHKSIGASKAEHPARLFRQKPFFAEKVAEKNRGHVLTCEQLARVSEDNFQRFMCLLGNRLDEGRWLPDGPFQTSKIV